MIYFIQQGYNGSIKIGFTSNTAEERLSALQTASPTKLHLIAAVAGDVVLEKELHKKYDKYRLEGEWFSVDILKELYTVSIDTHDDPFFNMSDEDLEDIRISHMGEKELEVEIKKVIKKLKALGCPIIWPKLYDDDNRWCKENPEEARKWQNTSYVEGLRYKYKVLTGKEKL